MTKKLFSSTAVAVAVIFAWPVLASEYPSSAEAPAQQQAEQPADTPRTLSEGRDTNIPVGDPSTATTRFPDVRTGEIDLDQPPQVGDRDEGAPAGQQALTPRDDAAGEGADDAARR